MIEQDLSASEMLDSISSFSKEDGHGAMAALAVFSHGTNRMIAGHDGSSSCQVQEVVDLFNSGNVHHIPKVKPSYFFLSFIIVTNYLHWQSHV